MAQADSKAQVTTLVPETDVSVLQNVDLDTDPITENLHYHYESEPRGAHVTPNAADRSLRIDPGLDVSFDAYFNNFYESYWASCTNVTSATLRLRLAGRGVVTVHRQSGEGQEYVLGRAPFESATAMTVEMPLDNSAGFAYSPGRVWFEIQAVDECTLFGGEWATSEPPVREVHPSAVFCTFNRVPYLSRILHALAERKDVYAVLDRIYIVNQGDPFELGDLVSGASDDFVERIQVIEQENLGGCGGFSRGIYETLADGSLTHFVLLDDDIRIHAESIFRAVRFMAHADEDVALGGHMLDLVRPNQLYEAGADFHPANALPIPIGHRIDLTEDEALETFLRVRTADYNGWWFFMASTSMVEEMGLPVPCFIRGDDMEYGARLGRGGKRTVPVPGIAVWHEPFYLKLGNWHYYFEVRNRLMMLSLHRNGDLRDVRRQIRRTFHRDAMLSRYNEPGAPTETRRRLG